jgi:hypothetical protein
VDITAGQLIINAVPFADEQFLLAQTEDNIQIAGYSSIK